MGKFIIANCTDVGKVRQVNEDSLTSFECQNGRVVVVCDGMGGQAAGDVASQLACNIIRDILENNVFSSPFEAITGAMVSANQGILHRVSQEPQLEGMGATCVMLIIKDDKVYYGWVGDSRIYYIANHTIRQLSKDQSYVQSLVDSGAITQEEAEHHPQKNEIVNALGVPGMTPPVLGPIPLTMENGSVILLCSDGLTGMVDNAHIERVVSKSDSTLQERAARLVELANQQGGLDNITVQLVQYTAEGESGIVASSSTKPGHKMWMWIGIVLLILVLVAGGYYYFNHKKDVTLIPAEQIDNRTTPAPNNGNAQSVGNKPINVVVNDGEKVDKENPKVGNPATEDKNDKNIEKKSTKDVLNGKSTGNSQSKQLKKKVGETSKKATEEDDETLHVSRELIDDK